MAARQNSGMKVTPVQFAMALLCGGELPSSVSRPEIDQRLKAGLEMMKGVTGEDFGYDLRAWHEYLTERWGPAYRSSRQRALPEPVWAAIKSPEWRAAVRRLTEAAGPDSSLRTTGQLDSD